MNLRLDDRFKDSVRGTFEKYELQVGILEDSKYRKPLRGERGKKGKDVLTTYAGTKVRKASRSSSQEQDG